MKKERGIALATVLILVLVFSVVGVAMMILSRRDVGESQRNRKSQMALAAAEAGIDQAIWELEQDSGWTGNTAWQTIGDTPDETRFICSVNTQNLQPNQYAIVCTGTATRAMNVSGGGSFAVNKRLKVLVQINPATPETLDDVVYTPCEIETSGMASPVLSDTINYTCGPGSAVAGTQTNSNAWLGIDVDTIRAEWGDTSLRGLATNQGRLFTGDVVWNTSSSLPLSNYGVSSFWNNTPEDTIPNVTLIEKDGSGNASFTLTGNRTFYGLLIVLGDPPPTCPPCPSGTPANGNVEFGGTADLEGAVYCTGEFWNHGTPDESGTVVCGRAKFSGHPSGITFNSVFAEQLGICLTATQSAGTTILSYQDISY